MNTLRFKQDNNLALLKNPRLKNIPHLDSLRFVAALGVILHHFLPDYELGHFRIGAFGVQVFFAISGFLITFILLQQKETGASRKTIIRNFFIKRALRLFPIYYLVIISFHLMKIFGLWLFNEDQAWFYYTYTSNILFFLEGWQYKSLNHTWTLAIEEQFYLIWPWLILFLPKKREHVVIIILILLSLTSKLLWDNLNFLPIAHLDTLGMGSLLAFLIRNSHLKVVDFIHTYRYPLFYLSSIIIGVGFYIKTSILFSNISLMMVSVILIICSYRGFKGYSKKVFDNKNVQYLGKISYGLYLYHKFIPIFVLLTVSYFGFKINSYILLIFSVMVTIVVSHLSFVLIESRFLNLKKKLDL